MATMLRAIYAFNAISISLPMTFFAQLEQAIQNFLCNHKRPRTILMNKLQAGGITLSDCRQYHKATVIKTVWHWYQNRQWDQWNRAENPEANSDTYGPLIFGKGGKNIKWEEVFSASISGKPGQLYAHQWNQNTCSDHTWPAGNQGWGANSTSREPAGQVVEPGWGRGVAHDSRGLGPASPTSSPKRLGQLVPGTRGMGSWFPALVP